MEETIFKGEYFEYRVRFTPYKGTRGGFYEPPEPDWYEVDSICIVGINERPFSDGMTNRVIEHYADKIETAVRKRMAEIKEEPIWR